MRVLAQNLTFPGGSVSGPPGLSVTNIGGLIGNVIPIVLGLTGFALLLMIISAGLTLMTSAGDAKKTESGKQRLTWAIVGFLVVFSAYWLVQILAHIFGLTEIGTSFGQ